MSNILANGKNIKKNTLTGTTSPVVHWLRLPAPNAGVRAQLCPTLCNPMDCTPPGSSVHAIFQVRILERVVNAGGYVQSLVKELNITSRN